MNFISIFLFFLSLMLKFSRDQVMKNYINGVWKEVMELEDMAIREISKGR